MIRSIRKSRKDCACIFDKLEIDRQNALDLNISTQHYKDSKIYTEK